MNYSRFTFFGLLLLSSVATPSFVLAGPGHDHGAESSSDGALQEIVLTETMINNLGIKTVPAQIQHISQTIDLVASIDYLPEKQAIVSARAEGSIAEIMVRTGEHVTKGQAVMRLQPRLVGNPMITLSAPMDGYVTEQNVVIGQSITPDQPLLRIADLSEVFVRGQAFEGMEKFHIAIDQKVLVTIPSFPDTIFTGTIQRIDAALKPGTRVRDILAVIDNPDKKLLANMQANMSILAPDASDEQKQSIIVPQRAILGDMGNYFLYVQQDDHFYRRDVTLGQKIGPNREITHGLKPDENVVVIGNYQLQFVTPATASDDDDGHGHAH